MTGIVNIKRCGTCHFGKIVSQDISKRICYGAPPSAVQLPAPNGKMTLQMVRPVVSVTDDACALYRGKSQVDMQHEDEEIESLRQPGLFQS